MVRLILVYMFKLLRPYFLFAAYPAAAVGSIPISTARRRGSVTFGKQSRNSLSPTAIIREMLEARFRWISSIMHGNEIFIKGGKSIV